MVVLVLSSLLISTRAGERPAWTNKLTLRENNNLVDELAAVCKFSPMPKRKVFPNERVDPTSDDP